MDNKVAVITGAGRVNGVGAATARILAKSGYDIVLNTLKNKEQANHVSKECIDMGAKTEIFIGDLTIQSECEKMACLVKSKFGGADVIVNCIGVTKGIPYERISGVSKEEFQRILDVNVIAPFLIIQAFHSMMKISKNSPAIINVSSAAGVSGKGSSIPYAVSKGAENTMTLSLAQALSPEIRVNAVCPSFIDSSWWEETFYEKEEKYKDLLKTMSSNNLLNKVLKPEDVASTIVSLIESPVRTGEIIKMDLGASIGKANKR